MALAAVPRGSPPLLQEKSIVYGLPEGECWSTAREQGCHQGQPHCQGLWVTGSPSSACCGNGVRTPHALPPADRAALALPAGGVAPPRQHKEQGKWPENPGLDPHLHTGNSHPRDRKGRDWPAALWGILSPSGPHAQNALGFLIFHALFLALP